MLTAKILRHIIPKSYVSPQLIAFSILKKNEALNLLISHNHVSFLSIKSKQFLIKSTPTYFTERISNLLKNGNVITYFTNVIKVVLYWAYEVDRKALIYLPTLLFPILIIAHFVANLVFSKQIFTENDLALD